MTASFDFREEASGAVLRLTGGVDFETAPLLCQQGLDCLEKVSATAIRVDLAGVTAANSVLFSVLIRWLAIARARSVDIVITGLSHRLYDVARVSGLETVLPLHTD